MECCSHKWMAIKLLILGLVLILVRMLTDWDIWIVLGVLVIVKAIILFFIPEHKSAMPVKAVKKKR